MNIPIVTQINRTTMFCLTLIMSLCAAGFEASANDFRLASMASSLITGCGNTMQAGAQHAAACAVDRTVLPMALNLMEASGKKAFGSHFSITNNLSYMSGQQVQGNVDVVMPLASEGNGLLSLLSFGNGTDGGALFMQQGATFWTDNDGLRRHDMRLGLVSRFQPLATRNDVFGVSLFQQQNLEYGHSRIVSSLDWVAGPSSSFAFNYYLPTTGWRATVPGYEEQALEGMEVSGNFDLPLSLRLNGAMGQWNVPGEAIQSRASRVGVTWTYNSWVQFTTNWRESQIADSGSRGFTVGAQVSFPFGGKSDLVPESLTTLLAYAGQRLADDTGQAGLQVQNQAWRPVEQTGQILSVRRDVTSPSSTAGIQLEFLQDTASSGASIQIKVSLSRPASEDLRYLLHLQPGEGNNPAVEGQDFSGDPIVVFLSKGESERIVTVNLVRNNSMEAPRSLGVTITPWS